MFVLVISLMLYFNSQPNQVKGSEAKSYELREGMSRRQALNIMGYPARKFITLNRLDTAYVYDSRLPVSSEIGFVIDSTGLVKSVSHGD